MSDDDRKSDNLWDDFADAEADDLRFDIEAHEFSGMISDHFASTLYVLSKLDEPDSERLNNSLSEWSWHLRNEARQLRDQDAD
jgi:hypothetical protein